MTDRDRLIELLKETEEHPEKTCPHYLEADCFDCPYDRGEDCDREARKADYLLANGVIVPPCKVGDTVYEFRSDDPFDYPINLYVTPSTVSGIAIFTSEDIHNMNCVGKTVFLTKEEAEEKLKELGKW